MLIIPSHSFLQNGYNVFFYHASCSFFFLSTSIPFSCLSLFRQHRLSITVCSLFLNLSFFNTFLVLPSSHRLNPFPLPQLFSSSLFLSFLQSPFPLHRRHRGFPPSFSTYAFTFSANFLLLRFLGRPQSRLHDSHPRKTLRLLRVLRLYEVLHAKTTWRFEPSGLSCLKKKAFITHDFAFYVC